MIYAESEEKHGQVLREVFDVIKNVGLKLNKEKYIFKTY